LGSNKHGSDNSGPHDTRTANKLDPRVDASQYGSAGNTTGAGGYSSTTGGIGHSSGGLGHSTHSDPTGPHDSHLGNKADPRVDSDRYGAAGNTSGAGGYGTGQYGEGHHGTTGGGLTGHSTTGGLGSTGRSDPTGPHDSHLANKADPRVDSDRYGAAGNTAGAGGYGTGQYGSTGHGTTGHGTTGELDHRPNEDGSLPKALTEDHSVAQPHSSLRDNQHSTGTHGTHGTDNYGSTTHGKPSIKDKLNPKIDADGDGKAGIMD